MSHTCHAQGSSVEAPPKLFMIALIDDHREAYGIAETIRVHCGALRKARLVMHLRLPRCDVTSVEGQASVEL